MQNRIGAAGGLVIAILVVTSLATLPLTAAGVGTIAPASTDATAGPTAGVAMDDSSGPAAAQAESAGENSEDDEDRPEDPSTNGTIGYVEGYWYDDELPVDDREDAVVEGDELEAVVYRSMARVEVIRGLTFEDDVPVEVITREEFADEIDEEFADLTETDHLHHDVRFEALFLVDRDTNATEAFKSLFGASVAGFYDSEEPRIAIVSDDLERPELNEVTLGHELHHALQDQHFDLQEYEGETRDRANAYDGLIEGAAVRVDTEYERRCQEEWDCVEPTSQPPPLPADVNWGIHFIIFQPYEDGPEFVAHLEEEGGWEAVTDAYADPPIHASEIIRPEEYGERDPVEIDHEDRSSDRWRELEADEETNRSTFGEAAMAAMFAAPGLEGLDESVIDVEEFLEIGLDGRIESIDYDQPVTDGWDGDVLVKYVTDEESIEESGYVWHTEWQSEEDAEEFYDGYRELLEIRDGEAIGEGNGSEATYEIDERFPGAYHVEHDGQTVTIVRAPSIGELEEIHDGISISAETDGATADDGALAISGFGLTTAVVALVVALAAAYRRG